MRLAVFGGAGFIGSHFVDLALESNFFSQVLVLDKITYAGSMKNLSRALLDNRVKFSKVDLIEPDSYANLLRNFEVVVNFAAESHVDRSISAPYLFAQVNSTGPCALASACLEQNVELLVQVSTDEVYGPVHFGESKEDAPILPTSPYSASKAAGEMLVNSFWRTYELPVIITRGCNTYGPRQFPEKLIPLAIRNFLAKVDVPMYGSGQQVREWIHVLDHAAAILQIIRFGQPGMTYNIGTGERLQNHVLLKKIAEALRADPALIRQVSDRQGHDFRYAIDSQKLRTELGWQPKYSLIESLLNCHDW